MRINKYIADAGICSRRAADKLIQEGRVKVNNKVVNELGLDIGPDDVVIVDGKPITNVIEYVYYIVNKPKGYLSTASDDRDRKTVLDLVPDKSNRLYPVGRLDYDTEGLLIITNDGDLTYKLTHPSLEIEKTYIANVKGVLRPDQLTALRTGVILDDGYKTKKAKVKVLDIKNDVSRVEITIHEGKNREIRRMFEALHVDVKMLKRVSMGPITVSGLDRGECRKLSKQEIEILKSI